MNYSLRHQQLAEQLRRAQIQALLVTHLPNIFYLCGFTGSAGVLLFQVGERGRVPKATLFTDGRYTEQARQEVLGARVVIAKGSALLEASDAILEIPGSSKPRPSPGKRFATKARPRTRRIGFESEHLSYQNYSQINYKVGRGTALKAMLAVVEELRSRKDREEIKKIRAAVELASGLFETALAAIVPGVSEAAVAGKMELQARKAGAAGMSFETIVASGPRSALPHGKASTQPIPSNGFIILDYGVILAGYCSDMTRTVHVGPVSDNHRRMYDAVLAAQLASIDTVRPGVETGEVDRAGREKLKKAGYDTYFTHSTGHGVGIEVHELPRLAKGQNHKLAPGMVVTIEPGIYIPGEGGVRIEDMVLVTESGHEVLTPTTKDLIRL
jgi:Xaa-Pro aminopeptidase